MNDDAFDEGYFLRGEAEGKSLYTDYRWLPDLTIPMVKAIIHHCGILPVDDVMDFGASRGYVVRAFRELGYQAFGVDVSRWAVENCDPAVKPYVGFNDWNWTDMDWVIAKDVLEHVADLEGTIDQIYERTNKGVFVVVPLSITDGNAYVCEAYERDVTHLHRLTLFSWMDLLSRDGWNVNARYRVEGIKQNYQQFEKGNGFLLCKRTDRA